MRGLGINQNRGKGLDLKEGEAFLEKSQFMMHELPKLLVEL